MNYKFNFPVLGLIVLMLLEVGCSPGSNVGATSAASTGGAQTTSNAPLIQGSVTNLGNASPLMYVTNITMAASLSAPAVAPATITMNFSNSVSSKDTPVTISMTVNGTPTGPLIGGIYTHTFTKPGANAIVVTATDSLGNTASAKFSLPVSCNASLYPAISMGSPALSGLSITPDTTGGAGYVDVTFPAATGGSGLGPFNYAIDLEGSGRFDFYQNQYWNPTNTFTNMYTLFNGTRAVRIEAFDTGCQMGVVFTKNVNFATILPPEQSGTPVPESYFYLQGDVTTLSNSTDPADTVSPFDGMEAAATNPPQHVLCSYVNGSFLITASNVYSDGNTSSSDEQNANSNDSETEQQMELGFNATDNGAAGGFTQNGVQLTSLVYQTPAATDGGPYNQYTYSLGSKSTNCKANVTVTRATAIAPCTTGTGTMSPTTTIIGTFSCNDITAPAVSPVPNGKDVSVTNAYFYCQVAPVNDCSGGTEGSGGEPPPSF